MKRIIFTTILIISILGLSACSKKEETAVAEETTPASTQAELTESETETIEETQQEVKAEAYIEEVIEKSPLIHLAEININKGMDVGTDYDGSAYVNYPAFTLLDEDAQNYPKLDTALQKLNTDYDTEYSERLVYSHKLGEDALADGTDMQISFYDDLTPEIRRADSHILSIFEHYESYTGGVHGYYAFMGDNYDPQTGEKLLLSDVIADKDAFRETVKEKLYARYPAEEFDDLDTALADMYTTENGEMPWTMDYSGITLYFNPYHIASYAAGMQVVTVPFNENPDLFVKDYLDMPDTYIQQLNSDAPAVIDVNDDGINEAILISSSNTEEDTDGDGYTSGYQTWTIHCGNEEISIADYCYYGSFYLVRANNQFYIYIFEVSDNDYSVCTVVDLKTMKNDKSKSFNACISRLDSNYRYVEGGWESIRSKYMLTDPEAMPLSSRTEILGSNSGSKIYRIGKDGWPASDDECFSVFTAMVYTAKQDIACKEVDENGVEKSNAKLNTGKHYVLVRTDNKSWADIQELKPDEYEEDAEYPYVYAKGLYGLRTDRPIYRLPYDGSSWPHTIDGVAEEELFDGILYAG